MNRLLISATLLAGLALPPAATAGSRILATGGVTPIEGGGGGGLTPWAMITSYAGSGELGATGFYTRVSVDDYTLTSQGLAAAWNDRVELSFARQQLDIEPLDLSLEQDVYGAKVRLAGRLLYSAMPQVSAGMQYKHNRDFDVPGALGASDDSGTDLYLSAAKLWFAGLLERNVLVNVTGRRTRANETGLLGFGAQGGGYDVVLEATTALFLNDRWAVGYEYRQKPDQLEAVSEHDWQDVFVGFFPGKHLSIVGAYVRLDEIAGLSGQDGWYLSIQAGF